MQDLIAALTILATYGNPRYPTHCEHDILTICGIEPAQVSDADKQRLSVLGFEVGNPHGDECFYSYRFGSA
jgi:hypothetical protein